MGANADGLTLALAALLLAAGSGLYVHTEPACDDADLSQGEACPAVMVQPYEAEGGVAVVVGVLLVPWGAAGWSDGDDGSA